MLLDERWKEYRDDAFGIFFLKPPHKPEERLL